jgi:hypothetical protein
LIKSATKVWNDISQVNNLEFQYHLLPGGAAILTASDVFQYPDKVYDFLSNLDYWETQHFSDTDIIRPGLTHQFAPGLFSMLGSGLSQRMKKIFGVSELSTLDMYIQSTKGDMTLDVTGGLCCYPHIDSAVMDSNEEDLPHIVSNLNLSKSSDPVRTGFWSFRGKSNVLEFNRDDKNAFNNFYDRHEDVTISEWFQINDYEDFKFESSVEMVYNSLVVYSTGTIHNPYIKPNWFADNDRLVLSTFFSVDPERLNFEEKDVDVVSYTWEHFRLDTLFNYHPQQTAPQF